ncbi:hypothetical protein, partial [Massilia brevitalea]|uniref:hypothetical protein n=1 Tax=Massilia brevitalea TaxID=442526 RepID=UPI002739E20B
HTYRLLIVKELIRHCLLRFDKSFCLSAAEGQKYKQLRDTRQPLFCYTAESAVLVATSTT